MRIIGRLFIGLLLVASLVFIFTPFMIGVCLEKWGNLGSFFLGIPDTDAKVVTYERHWFSTDITSSLKLDNSHLRNNFMEWGIIDENFPSVVELRLKEHIQHGPFFYGKLNHFNERFGIARITRQLTNSYDPALFSKLRLESTTLNFSGKLLSHFQVQFPRMDIPKLNKIARCELLDVNIWQWVFKPHVQGEIAIYDFRLEGEDIALSIPKTLFTFNLSKNDKNFWTGNDNLSFSEIVLRDAENPPFILQNLKTYSLLQLQNQTLLATTDINIQNLQYKEDRIGPLSLQLSAKGLNAEGVVNLLSTYEDIREHGELYESQLRQRLMAILPSTITPGSSLEVNQFTLNTPKGQMRIQAKLAWPVKKFVSLDSMAEAMNTSTLQATLRVEVPLANQILRLLAKLTYFYQIPPEERVGLLEMNDRIRLITQQNVYTITSLFQNNGFPDEEGLDLLAKMRGDVSFADYVKQVQHLLFARKLDLESSYLLEWLYLDLSSQINQLNQKLLLYQSLTEMQLQQQLDQFIKLGYVIKNNNEYLISLIRKDSAVKINGKNVFLN